MGNRNCSKEWWQKLWKSRSGVSEGRRIRSRQMAWQMIPGCLGSGMGRDREPPYYNLANGAKWLWKGVLGSWSPGGRKKRNQTDFSDRRGRWIVGEVPIAPDLTEGQLRRSRAALVESLPGSPKQRRLLRSFNYSPSCITRWSTACLFSCLAKESFHCASHFIVNTWFWSAVRFRFHFSLFVFSFYSLFDSHFVFRS